MFKTNFLFAERTFVKIFVLQSTLYLHVRKKYHKENMNKDIST